MHVHLPEEPGPRINDPVFIGSETWADREWFVQLGRKAKGETVQNMGVLPLPRGRPRAAMEWPVTIELSGVDGTKENYEVARGGGTDPHSTLDPLGLTLDDGKALLAGVQRHLVQARVSEYCALRRRCSRCRGLRPLKDTRTRRLNSLLGTVDVPAPRFTLFLRGLDTVGTLPSIGTHASPLHPRLRAGIGDDGRLAALSPRPAVPVRVLPPWR